MFNKKVILSFLFFAYSIILVHNIIPHNHHDDSSQSNIHYTCNKTNDHSENENKDLSHCLLLFHHHTTNENESCDACHFSVKTFIKISVSSFFIEPGKTFFTQLIIPESEHQTFIEFIDVLKPFYISVSPRSPPAFLT